MAFRAKKRKNANAKPLTLGDGTEVYEISESFSVNSLIDISFKPRKPIRNRHQKEFQRQLDAYIHEEAINTEAAKLNYIGCSLQAPDNEINKSINYIFNEESDRIYKKKSYIDEELPLQTYKRLVGELQTFVKDLNDYQSTDPNDKENIRLLVTGIQKLNETLGVIRKNKKYETILDKNYSVSSSGNQALLDSIMHIMNPQNDDDSKNDNGDDEDDDCKTNGKDSCLLYLNQRTSKTTGTPDAQFLDLESRISRLERNIGFVSDMKNPYPDALNAVELLELRYEYAIGKKWGYIKEKAGGMMNDLKNIKYHLDLMQARYKPTEKQTRLQWEKLEDLSILMNKWDRVLFELINIVKRLKSLQTYHHRTCLFINRVNKIYDQQNCILKSLLADQNTLKKTMESMENNTDILNKNAKYLMQRLNVVSKRLNIES